MVPIAASTRSWNSRAFCSRAAFSLRLRAGSFHELHRPRRLARPCHALPPRQVRLPGVQRPAVHAVRLSPLLEGDARVLHPREAPSRLRLALDLPQLRHQHLRRPRKRWSLRPHSAAIIPASLMGHVVDELDDLVEFEVMSTDGETVLVEVSRGLWQKCEAHWLCGSNSWACCWVS